MRTNCPLFSYDLNRVLISLLSLLLTPGVFVLTSSAQYNPYKNNFRGQKAFRQEIARLSITVERGTAILPIEKVPRLRRGDIIRLKMLDDPINGIRPNESRWDWTLAVAYINPSRSKSDADVVSREVNFRRDGWYREHLFKVPFDSQPIFFLYPRENYRKKIQKLINRNFDDVRKIGEKTLEIAGAYAQIGSFLNQLQDVIDQNPYIYRNNGDYYPYSYGGYRNYGNGSRQGDNFMREQFVERLAQSFSISLPQCWTGRSNRSSYNNSYGNNYNSNDFISRAQCVAQNVRLEDFDLSISQIIQQGGLLAATKLVKKYPELAHWINIAAVAVDLILKITRKTPLKIYPTISYSGNQTRGSYNQNTYASRRYRQNNSNQRFQAVISPQPVRVYANQSPTDAKYVSAFPIVLHKWQPQPDPEVIKLPTPSLLEPCLHLGRNILKNTDISHDWLRDPFARDFRLILSSTNGFTKELPLVKNIGMSGWEFSLRSKDILALPKKIKMKLESHIVATRGFYKIRSDKFEIPVPGGTWAVTDESKGSFAIGGIRRVVIKNNNGNCRCVRSVKYKPSFGGEFEFAANANANPLNISSDGTYTWFDIDTSEFKAGKGTLQVFSYGTIKPQVIPINLYGRPPKLKQFKVHKGDRRVIIAGERIEQIKALKINGRLALQDSQRKNEFVLKNRILASEVSIEMNLEGDRQYKYPKSFSVLSARPVLAVNEKGEIEAEFLEGPAIKHRNRFDLKPYPVAPVDIETMTIAVRTSLTDYSFRAGNISIETRIENDPDGQTERPEISFEVIDSVNLRIGFTFDKRHRKFIAGSRLQFRIRDRKRGDSNWYTIKQTFVRVPKIISVVCKKDTCRIIGYGLDYIGRFSTDGGKTWNPPLQAKATQNSQFSLTIPNVKDKRLLLVKLRDFENTRGFSLFR